jgi:hypothetical protein
MFKYKGGHRVGKGTYWNFSDGTRVDIAHEGVLPGDETTEYRRISPGMAVLEAPVIGLVYVVAMPFMAIGTIAVLAARKVLSGLGALLGSLVFFGWRPSEAHLEGKKRGRNKRAKGRNAKKGGKHVHTV